MVDENCRPAMASIGDDDISLSSSDSEQEEEYTVEEILAERFLDNSEPQYLVKWENYAEERWGLAFHPHRLICAPHPILKLTLR